MVSSDRWGQTEEVVCVEHSGPDPARRLRRVRTPGHSKRDGRVPRGHRLGVTRFDPVKVTYQGHEGVGRFFSQLPEHWQELRVEPEEFIDAGETIVVLVRLSGKGAGGSIDSKSVHLWRMRDGKAAAFREYPDTARVLQALGQQVPAAA